MVSLDSIGFPSLLFIYQAGVLRSCRENTAFPSGTGVRKYCAVNEDATLNKRRGVSHVSLDLVLEADTDRCEVGGSGDRCMVQAG